MIYLDNHSTTPLDPSALDAMLPMFSEQYANAGSITHEAGRQVAEIVERAVAGIAKYLGAEADELIVTSGATESNNLALLGACLQPRQARRKVVTLATEHQAILDPVSRLQQHGFEVQIVPVQSVDSAEPGVVDLDELSEAIDERTAIVSVMLANNEIGVIQPLQEIAKLCRARGSLLHCDATQAVGRIPVDVDQLDVDLMSFSAHKFYGPKGVGGLFVRRRQRRVRLQAQIVGGGQQHNFRSGTLNTAGIVGMFAALQSCIQSMAADQSRIVELRNRLFALLCTHCEDVSLNGPALDLGQPLKRLAGNLNCNFYPLEGQSLMLAVPELAVSSGSACTSANPAPSHVLRAIGLSEEQARSSLRFGVGRFNTLAEIELAAEWIAQSARKLRKFT